MEDKTDEEHPPLSDTEAKKMYRDADEVESFRAKALVLTGRLRALLEDLGITTTPRYRIKEVPRSGRVVIPHSKIVGTKPPYVCPGCFIHMYSNNMINRFHV
jgi:hypothetical protein